MQNKQSRVRNFVSKTTGYTRPSSSGQTESTSQETHTKTKLSTEAKEIYKYCVSRLDPSTVRRKKTHPNVEPPTMSSTHAWGQEQEQQLQLEASHEMLTGVW